MPLTSYAAYGEDFWLFTQFMPNHRGTAVDVGAHDGVETSNTFLLEQLGWRVLCVEASPEAEKYLRHNRDFVWMGACADYDGEGEFWLNDKCPGALSALKPVLDRDDWKPEPGTNFKPYRVQVRTLDSLLAENGFETLNVVSIDVEGGEMDVLRGFDIDRWRPRALVVEQWDDRGEVYRHLTAHGYIRVDRRHVNDLYVRSDG